MVQKSSMFQKLPVIKNWLLLYEDFPELGQFLRYKLWPGPLWTAHVDSGEWTILLHSHNLQYREMQKCQKDNHTLIFSKGNVKKRHAYYVKFNQGHIISFIRSIKVSSR